MYNYLLEIKVKVKKNINLEEEIIKKLRISKTNILDYKIIRESIDARDKANVFYNFGIKLTLNKEIKNKALSSYNAPKQMEYVSWSDELRPVIVGFGPAGMFSALYLARSNARPIIIERGEEVEKRKEKISTFFNQKKLDKESNVVFGEGGAGTFSDGKLQSNIKNEWNYFVLNEFVKHGANEDVLTSNYPHVGTDKLEIVVKNIREEIKSLGGEFYFSTLFNDFEELSDCLIVKTNRGIEFKTHHLLLGLGHSAVDTFNMLNKKGIKMEPKPFSMGVRIEHLQDDINKMQYGDFSKILPPAPYKLACHLENRSVYSFCMCPGGYVVASANNPNTIVTNGMSYSKRDGINSNSALLVEIKPEDYYNGNPLDGFSFQEKYEKLAYGIANDYRAPANLIKEFLNEEIARTERKVKTTYPHGIVMANLKDVLPDFVVSSLQEALPIFDKKMPGFADNDAILIGVETRSSSPVRISRENYRSSQRFLYPMGEGSGYAGGIMTSALDGLKVAMFISNKLKEK